MGIFIEPLISILRVLNIISFINRYFIVYGIVVSSFSVFNYISSREVSDSLFNCKSPRVPYNCFFTTYRKNS